MTWQPQPERGPEPHIEGQAVSSADPLGDAIAAEIKMPMVTHYVVVAAAIDHDGTEITINIPSPGLPLWMAHGLLSYEAAASVPQPSWIIADDREEP